LGSENASLFAGTLVAMVSLFVVPLIFLGMVSPFSIRLLARGDHHAGGSSGTVFALSTIGSMIGAYLPTFVLIPWLGTQGTLRIAAAAVILSASLGLLLDKRPLFGLAALTFLLLPGLGNMNRVPPKGGRGLIEQHETEYHLVRVGHDVKNKLTYLELNEGLSFHSLWFDDGRRPPGYWGYLECIPLLLRRGATSEGEKLPLRVCILGLGCGTIATRIQHMYTNEFDLQIDGVEIDPVIVQMGRKHFALEERHLHVFIEDARTFLIRTMQKYDILIVDAYRQPYIPAHLVTKEFFEVARDRLKPGGIFCINIGSIGTESLALRGIQNAMVSAFQGFSTERFEVQNSGLPYSNFICLACQRTLRPLWDLLAAPEIRTIRDAASKSWMPLVFDRAAPAFTDDRCAIEFYTDSSIFDYVRNR
jgi:predicted membrane-bound spermidine synthase